jgi:hypothetical protein
MRILDEARVSAARADAASAFAAFFCESFSARFWASMDREARFCSMTSTGGVRERLYYSMGWISTLRVEFGVGIWVFCL